MTTARREKSIWYVLCPLGIYGLLKGDLKIRTVTEKYTFPNSLRNRLEMTDEMSGAESSYYHTTYRIITVEPGDRL